MKKIQIKIGDVLIGDGAPISVQSMTNTKTDDVKKTVEQISCWKSQTFIPVYECGKCGKLTFSEDELEKIAEWNDY